MSVREIRLATGDASTHKLKWSSERFVLVPSLGVIGVPEKKGDVSLLTFHVQPYDSSITCPGLTVTNPFRGRIGDRLSFSNHIVSRKEVEATFGPVREELTNYAQFFGLPDKTEPFSFRGQTLHYPRLGLSFDLERDAVISFSIRRNGK